MMNQLSVPALAPNQRIEDWAKIYKTATAGLDTEKKKVDYLPLYICRNEGEREIAFLATEEDTLDKALAKISELIEGKPSPVETTRRFFDFNTADRSKDLKSVFFSLRALGDAAAVTKDIVMLRFLGLVPAGERFFEENKASFIPEMTDAQLLALFIKFQPKLNQASIKRETISNNVGNVKQERSGDGYVFTTEEEGNMNTASPPWLETMENMRGELNSIKDYLIDKDEEAEPDNETPREPSEAEAFYIKQASKERKRCYICDKTSHFAAQCFMRKCEVCKRTGHSAHECKSCEVCKRTGHSAHECRSGKPKPSYGHGKKNNTRPNL